MPILANAKKALRRSKRAYQVNARIKARMRSAVKQVSAQPTAESLADAYSKLDMAVKGKIIHRNKAARVKGQLAKLVKPDAKAGQKKAPATTQGKPKSTPKSKTKAKPKATSKAASKAKPKSAAKK